jgi:hypothetical protein
MITEAPIIRARRTGFKGRVDASEIIAAHAAITSQSKIVLATYAIRSIR